MKVRAPWPLVGHALNNTPGLYRHRITGFGASWVTRKMADRQGWPAGMLPRAPGPPLDHHQAPMVLLQKPAQGLFDLSEDHGPQQKGGGGQENWKDAQGE